MSFLQKEVGIFFKAFDNSKNPKANEILTLQVILDRIKSGHYKESVDYARNTLKMEGEKEYKKFKQNSVHGFTLSARCEIRKKDTYYNDSQHTGLLQIDFDRIYDPQKLIELKNKLKSDPFTAIMFLSVGGNGLKCGIKIDPQKHLESFLSAETYYLDNYGLKIDKSCKDVYRLCFVSHDPDLYINENSVLFDPEKIQKKAPPPKPKQNKSAKCLQIIHNKLIAIRATDESRHQKRLEIAKLAGGYVSGGLITKDEAENVLKSASDLITRDGGETNRSELKTLFDGLQYGMSQPITSLKNRINKSSCLPESIDKFWVSYEIDNKSHLEIQIDQLYEFLFKSGFRKIKIHNAVFLVRIINKVIKQSDVAEMRNAVKNYIDSLPEEIDDVFTKYDLFKRYLEQTSKLISDDKIDTFFTPLEINILKDSSTASYVFFQNYFIEITATSRTKKAYSELPGYIWEAQIIKHDIEILPTEELLKDNYFSLFLQNICKIIKADKKRTEWEVNENKFNSLFSCIGYLLYTKKESNSQFAVVLTEESMEEKPEGRTGKGLIMQAINKIRPVVTIDGKNLDKSSSFLFEQVKLDTAIIFFDDIQKNMNFETLFSLITEGISVNKKFEKAFYISASNAPKIAISTNYCIRQNSGSANARKYEMELSCYYSSGYTPREEFNNVDFWSEGWDSSQWNKFYNIMFYCLSSYFANNKTIPEYNTDSIEKKKIMLLVGSEFFSWAELYFYSTELESSYESNKVYKEYVEVAKLNEYKFTKNSLSNKIKEYCKYKGWSFTNEPQRDGMGGVERTYNIKRKLS